MSHRVLPGLILLLSAGAGLCAPATAPTWGVVSHDGAGRTVRPYLSSLAGGEFAVGAVRSEAFTLDADLVSFELCGWDGPPNGRQFRNCFALCDAATGLALRRVHPPQTDALTPVRWDVIDLVGRRVYFRVVDGISASGYAWLGYANVRVGDRVLLGSVQSGGVPAGWLAEAPPADLPAERWLACPSAGADTAVEEEQQSHTWGLMTTNGEGRPCAPYLSSLKGGESGTGAVRSPSFTLNTPRYTFVVMGADSPTGDQGLSSFQLVDAATLKILRRAGPIVGNTLLPVTWETADLVGRRVFFRAVDRNAAPSWAWLGCDRIPLGDRVVSFSEPGALAGWREEGLADGELAPATQGLSAAALLESEWQRQDAAAGIRWELWQQSPAVAPHLIRRLLRVLEADLRRARCLQRDFLAAAPPTPGGTAGPPAVAQAPSPGGIGRSADVCVRTAVAQPPSPGGIGRSADVCVRTAVAQAPSPGGIGRSADVCVRTAVAQTPSRRGRTRPEDRPCHPATACAAELRAVMAGLRAVQVRAVTLQRTTQEATAWKALRRDEQGLLRRLAFHNPALDFDALLLVKRYTQQSYADINVNHHAWGSRPGGDIIALSGFRPGETPRVRPLLAGRLGPGNVHGIDLDFDAGHVVFAYSRSRTGQPPEGWTTRQYSYDLHRALDLLHLYEMRSDGGELRQLTGGGDDARQWSDLNPCYLPDGDIAFESERCGFSLQCNEYDKDEPTTNLYRLGRDGHGLRRLSVTKDGDWYPRVLPDGSLVYSHWEYHERSLMFLHPLWLIRPDGTGADNFAKQHFDYPLTLTVPRPVPGSEELMAIAAGHHTLAAGPVVLVDRRRGPNDPACLTRLTGPDVWPELGGAAPPPDRPDWRAPPGQGWYMDPYPLSPTTFLAAYCHGAMQDEAGYGLYLVDAYGGRELLYRDPAISCVAPLPLRPRVRPPVTASVLQPQATTATCLLTDVTEGVPELARGAVSSLRIAEPVSWPYTNATGGQRYEPDAKATGVNWTPVRILGTVPVAADGSAYFTVPADRALYFQALDAEGMELRRMRSYVSFQPGETRGCAGCHETRAAAPRVPRGLPLAMRHPASTPAPPPWGQAPLSFLRDVQPLLSRNCLRCHSGLKPAGKLDLSPGLTAGNNRAYDSLVSAGLLCLSSKGEASGVTVVKAVGSHRSRLLEVLRTTHRERCRLAAEDWQRLYTWIDANGIYHDGFLVKRPATAAGYSLPGDTALWQRVAALQARRCASCHGETNLARPEWVDLREPEKSLFLAAPRGEATPSGRHCPGAPYTGAGEGDYRELLALVEQAVQRVWAEPRRDLRNLRSEDVAAR